MLRYFFQIQIIAIWCIKYCFISSSKLETWEFYLKAKLFGGIVSVRIPGGLPFLLSGVKLTKSKYRTCVRWSIFFVTLLIRHLLDFVKIKWIVLWTYLQLCLETRLLHDISRSKTKLRCEGSKVTKPACFRLIWLDSSKKVRGFFRKTIHLHHVNRWTKKAVKEAEMKRVLSHHLNLTPRIVDQE